MSRFECPNCGGGFSKPQPTEGGGQGCPWCHQRMDGSVDPPVTHTVASVESDNGDRKQSGLRRLLTGGEAP